MKLRKESLSVPERGSPFTADLIIFSASMFSFSVASIELASRIEEELLCLPGLLLVLLCAFVSIGGFVGVALFVRGFCCNCATLLIGGGRRGVVFIMSWLNGRPCRLGWLVALPILSRMLKSSELLAVNSGNGLGGVGAGICVEDWCEGWTFVVCSSGDVGFSKFNNFKALWLNLLISVLTLV